VGVTGLGGGAVSCAHVTKGSGRSRGGTGIIVFFSCPGLLGWFELGVGGPRGGCWVVGLGRGSGGDRGVSEEWPSGTVGVPVATATPCGGRTGAGGEEPRRTAPGLLLLLLSESRVVCRMQRQAD
jgi:hypothetical protein